MAVVAIASRHSNHSIRPLVGLIIESGVEEALRRERVGKKTGDNFYDVQRAIYKRITGWLWARFNGDVRKVLQDMADPPTFQTTASLLWQKEWFIAPIIAGYCVVLGQRMGVNEADRPLFSFSIDRGEGVFNLTFRDAWVYATPEKLEARAFIVSQLLAHATLAVLTDQQAAVAGLAAARRIAGFPD